MEQGHKFAAVITMETTEERKEKKQVHKNVSFINL